MARDFAWRDVLAFIRYRDRAVFLDNALRLTYAPGMFSSVLLSLVFPRSGFVTTWQSSVEDSSPALGQMYRAPGKHSARLTFLAPADPDSRAQMVRVISHLCQQAGERGAFHILAEVQRESPLEDCLRQSGFRAYAEQWIWMVPGALSHDRSQPGWTPFSEGEGEAIQRLYRKVIPRDVQRVEAPPRVEDLQGLSYWADGELAGFAVFHQGPKGVLMDLIIDPAESNLEDHIAALCEKLPPQGRKKTFFRVRTYQKKLISALERVGAVQCAFQLAMVKHVAVHFRAKQPYQVGTFETQPDVTTPFVKSEDKNTTYVKS